MPRVGVLAGSLFIVGSFLVGCVSYEPGEDGAGEPIAETDASLVTPTQRLLPGGAVTLSNGMCHRDGIVIQDGEVYRLGHRIGPDVTGITSLSRVSNGQAVCHNTTTWGALLDYVCKVNTAAGNNVDSVTGTFSGPSGVANEWIDKALVQYPNVNATEGLFLGHAVLADRGDTTVFPNGDPCPASRPMFDFPLSHIECCATAPTPPVP